MKQYTDAELAPYMKLLKPLQGFTFSENQRPGLWIELAIALKETSASEEHAGRIVARFVREPRYDGREQLVTTMPAAIELRVFAQRVPPDPMAEGGLAEACELCAPNCGMGVYVTVKDGSKAIAYCECERGQRLKAMQAKRLAAIRSRSV